MTHALNNVNVYLILKQHEDLLLYLRQNTGYQDGFYGFVSGHVEKGENAKYAMIREAYEEINITIKPEHLNIVHVMHRKSDRENIDIFMNCHKWDGNIINNEPEKCGELAFFPFTKLPKNTIDFIKEALINIDNKIVYSEHGW